MFRPTYFVLPSHSSREIVVSPTFLKSLSRTTIQTVSIQVDQLFLAIDLPNRASRYSLTPVTTYDAPARLAEVSAVTSWLGGSRYSRASVDVQFPKFVQRRTTEQYREESA